MKYANVELFMDTMIGAATVAFTVENGGMLEVRGSGTLVCYDSFHGILTAGHVFQSFQTLDYVGVCLFPPRKSQYQTRTLDLVVARRATSFEFDQSNVENLGPDLAFIPLSEAQAADFSAYARFHRLSEHTSVPTPNNVQYAFNGAIAEISTRQHITAQRKTLEVEGRMIVGQVSSLPKAGTRSRQTFQANEKCTIEELTSLGGMSGGGVWRFALTQDHEGQVTCEYLQFAGIGFFQVQTLGDEPFRVICHDEYAVADFLGAI